MLSAIILLNSIIISQLYFNIPIFNLSSTISKVSFIINNINILDSTFNPQAISQHYNIFIFNRINNITIINFTITINIKRNLNIIVINVTDS